MVRGRVDEMVKMAVIRSVASKATTVRLTAMVSRYRERSIFSAPARFSMKSAASLAMR
ncbi:hypothetical protein D3C80_2141130 [compost metagenome]